MFAFLLYVCTFVVNENGKRVDMEFQNVPNAHKHTDTNTLLYIEMYACIE